MKIKLIAAEIASSNGAIWNVFSEQRKQQSIKKASVLGFDQHFFYANKVQFNAQFGWVSNNKTTKKIRNCNNLSILFCTVF